MTPELHDRWKAMLGFASRFSACLLMLGFSLVPPLLVFHLLGFPIAALFLLVELAVCVFVVASSLHRQRKTFRELVCTPVQAQCNINPLLVCALCAASFLAPGIWIILTSGPPTSGDPNAMTASEQVWFGAVVCLLGAGICGLSATQWLADRHD